MGCFGIPNGHREDSVTDHLEIEWNLVRIKVGAGLRLDAQNRDRQGGLETFLHFDRTHEVYSWCIHVDVLIHTHGVLAGEIAEGIEVAAQGDNAALRIGKRRAFVTAFAFFVATAGVGGVFEEIGFALLWCEAIGGFVAKGLLQPWNRERPNAHRVVRGGCSHELAVGAKSH